MSEKASANVGSEKDSDKRQRAAIASFAKARGYRIARTPMGDVPDCKFECVMERMIMTDEKPAAVDDEGAFVDAFRAEFTEWLDREWATYLAHAGDAWSIEGFRVYVRSLSQAPPEFVQLVEEAEFVPARPLGHRH